MELLKLTVLIFVLIFGSGLFSLEGVAKMPATTLLSGFGIFGKQVKIATMPVRINRVYYRIEVNSY